MRSTAVLALIAVLAVAAHAQQTSLVTSVQEDGYRVWTVDWRSVEERYPDVTSEQGAACGDRVVFKWEGEDLNVGVAKNGGACDSPLSMATNVTSEGEAEFVLDENLFPIVEFGEVYFATDVNDGQNCRKGQLIEFYIDCNGANTAAGIVTSMVMAAAMGAAALLLAA